MIRSGMKWLRDQQGSTVVLVGLSFTLLLTATGLVVDGGTMYAAKSHLQKTANAAALSGAQKLTYTESDVKAIITDILKHHGEQASLTETDIQMKSTVRVHLRKKVPLGFSKLFGKKDVNVEVQAAAQIVPMGTATGAAPLGIDESIQLQYNTPYMLKVDSHDVNTGYFGVLALGGPGADTYENNLKNGFQSEITTGNIIDTQTGNIAGKTREAVQFRINSDPYPPGDYSHPDSPRVILIPVYRSFNQDSNQMKQIEVTGFAYFYILEPMSSTDDSIRGMFIESLGVGSTKPGAVDKGAHVIRLIE